MLPGYWLRGLISRIPASRQRASIGRTCSRDIRRSAEMLETRVLPAVTFQFDYSRDTGGFFADQARRDVLEEAGNQVGGQLQDVLFEIIPHQLDPADTWTARFADPSGPGTFDVVDPIIGENVILVYVGGQNLGGTLAFGGPASIPSVSGVQEFVDTVIARGQFGALDSIPSDFGAFGGAITFDSTMNWHFGQTTIGLDAGEFDFLSTARRCQVRPPLLGRRVSVESLFDGCDRCLQPDDRTSRFEIASCVGVDDRATAGCYDEAFASEQLDERFAFESPEFRFTALVKDLPNGPPRSAFQFDIRIDRRPVQPRGKRLGKRRLSGTAIADQDEHEQSVRRSRQSSHLALSRCAVGTRGIATFNQPRAS